MDRFAGRSSANGDPPSQWRAYGKMGGLRDRLRPARLRDLIGPEPRISLRQITYGGKTEDSLVDDLVSRFKLIIEPHPSTLDQTGWDRQSARNRLSTRFDESCSDLVDEIKDRLSPRSTNRGSTLTAETL